MNNEPLVSVIIPFYNNKEWLEEAIGSVLSQSYSNYEIIVINDGSKENMDDFLEKHRGTITFIEKRNGGPASARNMGISTANGEYIAFLDSDDLWVKDKLEYQIERMIKTNSQWSQTSYELFGNGKDGHNVYAIMDPQLFSKMLFISNSIATPTVIIKKTLLDDENIYFDENKRYGEDIDLWIRLSKKSDVLSINKYLTKVRIRGANAGLSAAVQLQSRAEMYENVKLSDKISNGLKFNYKICRAMYNVLCFIEHIITKNQQVLEVCAKVLYLLPYSVFKLYKIKYMSSKNIRVTEERSEI